MWDSRESEKGKIFKKYFARVSAVSQGRAPKPSGKLLTHRSKDRVSVSGLCTRVPGTARVWSAAADTPKSTQAVSCGLRQTPGRVRRASARESPCQTPEVGRQRVAGGSGVALPFRVGSRPRETKRGAKQRGLTQSPMSQKNTASDTQYHKRTNKCLTSSTTDTAQDAHVHVLPLVTPTWFHSLTHSLTHSLSLSSPAVNRRFCSP